MNIAQLTNPVPMTADYQPPTIYGMNWFWMQNRPPFNPIVRVPEMTQDPRVIFGLDTIKGPLNARARFYVDCDDTSVKEFLVNNITRFWRTSVNIPLQGVEWGWSGSEVMYKRDESGQIRFDRLVHLQPRDVKARTTDGRLTSIGVKGVTGHTGEIRLGGMKGFWYTHWREQHRWHGRSRLFGAYPAWLEYWTPDGARDMRRLFFHKYAYDGGTAWYPVQNVLLPDGSEASSKEIMREAVEKKKSGGMYFFPAAPDPNTPWFRIDPPTTQPPPTGLMEYMNELEAEIFSGMVIPKEILSASETGSGYSGRLIPLQAFFYSLQQIVNTLISDVDAQILRPLVRLNFGRVPEYEIIPLPLHQNHQFEGGNRQDLQQEPVDQQGSPVSAGEVAHATFADSDTRVVDYRRGELRSTGIVLWHRAA